MEAPRKRLSPTTMPSWPTSLPSYVRSHGLQLRGAAAGHGISALTTAGAIRSRAILPPPAATARPKDFMALVDKLHQAGHRRHLDWVPAHFPKDPRPYRFDGTPATSTEPPQRGEHKEWGTMVFDYGKPEVQSFLMSSSACTGWSSTTSTACAWTPWPPCCIWTTTARRRVGAQQGRRQGKSGGHRLPA